MAIANGDDRSLARGSGAADQEGRAGQAGPRPNPTPRQQELGIRLRRYRNELGLTLDQVATELLVSATKISRLETGLRKASQRDVRDLCRIYGVRDPGVVAELMELARQAREPGWWKRFDDLGPGTGRYLGLEQAATAITYFSATFIPGLLQSAEYARAVIRGIERTMDPRSIEQRVEARMVRQELLEGDAALTMRVLLDESVLYRNIGGQNVMRQQLDLLIRRASASNVSLQIVPLSAERFAAVDGGFELLEFGEGSAQMPVIHVESLARQFLYVRPAELTAYRRAIDYLREAALSTDDSLRLVHSVRDSGMPIPGNR